MGVVQLARPPSEEDRLLPPVADVTAELPLGYRVTFRWAHEKRALSVRWWPRQPLVRDDARLRFTPTADRFRRAYVEARRDFIQGVANVLGEPVTMVDHKGSEVIRPNRVH